MPCPDKLAHHATHKTYQYLNCQRALDVAKSTASVTTGSRKVDLFFQPLASPRKTKVLSNEPKYLSESKKPRSAAGSASTPAEPPVKKTQPVLPDSTLDDESDPSPNEEVRKSGPHVAVEAVSDADKARDQPQPSNRPGGTRRREVNKTIDRPLTIRQAVEKGDSTSLKTLLDAHPYAGPDPKDRSTGTLIFRFFRQIASWFNSDASAWQGKQAVKLLEKAAAVGNVDVINILVDRCMDLGTDIRMIAPALYVAVAKGKPGATELLLKKALEIKPDYSLNVSLTTIAARRRRADVLEILVSNGMALPARAELWSRYGKAIGDYLKWAAAGRQGTDAPELLSFVAQGILGENDIDLKHEFGRCLNGGDLNQAQKACSVQALVKVDAKTYTEAGFTERTAKAMADAFNANASRHIARNSGNALATLAKAVTDEFDNFKENGFVWPYLREHLMNQGMYGVLADLVVTAFKSAAKQSMAQDTDREMLLADALEKCAGEAEESLDTVRNASGDPDLFDKLLSPQLDLLIAYCDAQRKRTATTKSGQPRPAAGAD